MASENLCWEILPKVSRSFALCIRILPKPLNEQMMVSYLLYRVLDTIEDSSAPLPVKKELFSQFVKLLAAPHADSSAINECKAALCTKLNYTYEKDLLENLGAVMQAYYAQPAPARHSILKWGRIMAEGMYEFQQKPIETFADQNAYS
ncbi:MAG: squalene/phytoene synthase family protein [Candidatus Burarchaeum sp.]|nr:squalene/phytoene synthase family protein [Candidatus Burarchaeum sp.]MDO8339659.1 squalene/phytoene synthase family protein [Candidatus Burarchaeum sp.]